MLTVTSLLLDFAWISLFALLQEHLDVYFGKGFPETHGVAINPFLNEDSHLFPVLLSTAEGVWVTSSGRTLHLNRE